MVRPEITTRLVIYQENKPDRVNNTVENVSGWRRVKRIYAECRVDFKNTKSPNEDWKPLV